MISFNVWKFSFNELRDLKNWKKLISGTCLTPIIQSYIIYIYENDLHKMHYGLHIFLLIYFIIYNYLLFFESDHIWFQHHFIHVCPSQLFFHYYEKFKNQRYPFKEDTSMYGLCIFKKFLDVYILPCRFFFEFIRSCCLVF